MHVVKNGAPLRSVFVCPCMFVVQARRGEIGNSLFSVEHGELENNILCPCATSTSYIKNTTDFLSKLQKLSDLPNDTIQATMYVTSFYTNMPHADGLKAIKNIMPEGDTGTTTSPHAQFLLHHNYFKFGDSQYSNQWHSNGNRHGPSVCQYLHTCS